MLRSHQNPIHFFSFAVFIFSQHNVREARKFQNVEPSTIIQLDWLFGLIILCLAFIINYNLYSVWTKFSILLRLYLCQVPHHMSSIYCGRLVPHSGLSMTYSIFSNACSFTSVCCHRWARPLRVFPSCLMNSILEIHNPTPLATLDTAEGNNLPMVGGCSTSAISRHPSHPILSVYPYIPNK